MTMQGSSQMCAQHIPHEQPDPFDPGAGLDLLDEDGVIEGIHPTTIGCPPHPIHA